MRASLRQMPLPPCYVVLEQEQQRTCLLQTKKIKKDVGATLLPLCEENNVVTTNRAPHPPAPAASQNSRVVLSIGVSFPEPFVLPFRVDRPL